MIIHEQRSGCREVAGFAESQQAPIKQDLAKCRGVRRQPGGGRPGEQRYNDEAAPIDAVRKKAAERAEPAVGHEEDRREQAELRVGHRDRFLDRAAHGDQDHSIQIIQARHDPQQGDDQPRAGWQRVGVRGHARRVPA